MGLRHIRLSNSGECNIPRPVGLGKQTCTAPKVWKAFAARESSRPEIEVNA